MPAMRITLVLAVSILVLPFVGAERCDGAVRGNVCFWVTPSEHSFAECAMHECGEGGSLACISSKSAQQWVHQQVLQKAQLKHSILSGSTKAGWFGMYQKEDTEDPAVGWEGLPSAASPDCGGPPSFTNWKGSPDGNDYLGLTREHCGAMVQDSGDWVDAPCSAPLPCLCQRPSITNGTLTSTVAVELPSHVRGRPPLHAGSLVACLVGVMLVPVTTLCMAYAIWNCGKKAAESEEEGGVRKVRQDDSHSDCDSDSSEHCGRKEASSTVHVKGTAGAGWADAGGDVNAGVGVVAGGVVAFRQMRESKKKRVLSLVLRIGAALFVTGLAGGVLGFLTLMSGVFGDAGLMIILSAGIFMFWLVVVAFVIMCTTSAFLDLDEFFLAHPNLATAFASVLFFGCAVFSFFFAVSPHLGSLALPPLVYFLLWRQRVLEAHHGTACANASFVLCLLGQGSTYLLQGNSASVVLGAVWVVGGAVTLAVWGCARGWRWGNGADGGYNGGRGGEGAAALISRTDTFWLVAHCSLFVVGLASQLHDITMVWVPYGIVDIDIVSFLPHVLVPPWVYYRRRWLYAFMSRRFEGHQLSNSTTPIVVK